MSCHSVDINAQPRFVSLHCLSLRKYRIESKFEVLSLFCLQQNSIKGIIFLLFFEVEDH